MANSTTHERKGGLRGHDKQQGALVDQGDDHGMMRDERGQDQPRDKEKAQENPENPGQRAQKDAAKAQVQSPGEPAGGE